MKIGIPRSIFYYYFGYKWKCFFKYLNIEIVLSPETNRKIVQNGVKFANDEMCMSMKTYFGHVHYLIDKCDYILIPRIDNYGYKNQTCTNFLALYDIINNVFDCKILNYNIDYENNETELKGLLKLSKILDRTKKEIKDAYYYACIKEKKYKKQLILENKNKLNSNKHKVLVIGHSYNINDELIGKPILKNLEKLNCEIIYSDKFEYCKQIVNQYSKNLYWKYSKEALSSLKYLDKVDGVLFISTFPCGLDSLVNELVFRKLNKPYLNLIIDDLGADAGMETRIESFVDIFEY